jgi:hypothetical protein
MNDIESKLGEIKWNYFINILNQIHKLIKT